MPNQEELMQENVMFDAPVAGQSLTKPLGGKPWQQPPKYSTVEEAMEFYMAHFEDSKFVSKLIQSMEMNVKITSLAHLLTMKGIMDGVHSIDIAMLVQPALMEMIMIVGDKAGVKYRSGVEEEMPNIDDVELRQIIDGLEEDDEVEEAINVATNEGIEIEEDMDKVPTETESFMTRRK